MPASVRAHVSRGTSSRPYDRCSPTVSPALSENPHLSRRVSPASPIQTPDTDGDPDVPPDHPGLPTYAEYKRIESGYLLSLSPRKRDKALITQAMFDKIWDVLHQPEACTIDTPQFRFWVRKMFTLNRPSVGGLGLGLGWDEQRADADEADLDLERSMGIGVGRTPPADAAALGVTAVVLHENRPVAIMEQLYELFCYCHVRAGHGGRDKTCAIIREHYSWVPKELTAQFVKACPTCTLKRSGQCVDVGVFAHRRVVRRRRKGRAVDVEVPEETSVPVDTLSLGWPTTGGPLDPANPEPCGMQEREQEWQLRGLGDAGTTGASSPASSQPALESTTQSTSRDVTFETCSTNGWSSVPRALTLDASPFAFDLCDTPSVASPGYPLAEKRRREGTKIKTGLASLTSGQSNESLDEHLAVNPSGRAEGPAGLQPLRLLGGLPESDLAGSSSNPGLQIDPVLLSFDYPGLGLSSGPDFTSGAVHLGLASSEVHDFTDLPGRRSCRLRALSDVSMTLPALDPSQESDSPDLRFERTLSLTPYTPTTEGVTLPLSLSTEFMRQSRCESRYDSPLSMFYSCSVDEVGSELDRPFSMVTNACRI